MATDLKTTSSWIQKTSGVCGGRACLRNTRITVWGLVNSRRLGAADEELLQNVVGLSPEDLQKALALYGHGTGGDIEDLSRLVLRKCRFV